MTTTALHIPALRCPANVLAFARAKVAPGADWRVGMRASFDPTVTPFVVWLTVPCTSRYSSRTWETISLSFATAEECVDAAVAYIRDRRTVMHSVRVWRWTPAPDYGFSSGNARNVGGVVANMKGAKKIGEMVARVESLRSRLAEVAQ